MRDNLKKNDYVYPGPRRNERFSTAERQAGSALPKQQAIVRRALAAALKRRFKALL
jgi:hypothetical protein